MDKIPPDKYFTCVKNTMKNMYKKDISEESVKIINDAVIRTNKIVFHTYNFLNLYFSYRYNTDKIFPHIDNKLIMMIMKTVSKRTINGGRAPNNSKRMQNLKKFYDEHYSLLNPEYVDNTKLTQILSYEATDIVTNVNVNISEHYIQHLNKYIHIFSNIRERINNIKPGKDKIEKITTLNKKFRNVVSYILDPKTNLILDENDKEDKLLIEWAKEERKNLVPSKEKFAKDSIPYDVKVKPQDYLKCMFYMNENINFLNEHNKDGHQFKTFRVLPSRRSLIPKNITLDTAAINTLIRGVSKKQDIIWTRFFDMKNPVFRKKEYKFHHLMKTDGVSCSLMFIKKGYGTQPQIREITKNNKNKKNKKKEVLKPIKAIKEKNPDTPYIEEVKITKRLKSKRKVAIDPNHGNLISCLAHGHPINNKGKLGPDITFRYTRKQRNQETKSDKYKTIRNKKIKKTKIEGKSIEEIQSSLSEESSKDYYWGNMKAIMEKKIKISKKIEEHYKDPIYRKLKMNMYINTQKSESKMIKNFEEKFGDSVTIIFGDYSKKEAMKGSEPHISKRLRRLFKVNGYETYLIDEYCTSKICNKCHGQTENFEITDKDGVKRNLWSLLRCKNVNCKTIHNRDHNSPRNFLNIVESVMKGNGRPVPFTRR